MFFATTVNQQMVDISTGEAGLIALMGYLVVFIGLIALMCVVLIMGKLMVASQKRKQPAAAAPVQRAEPVPSLPAAPGTAGQIKLYNVPDKEAAMIMAIVANKLHKPLNELRFLSIKEV